MKAHTGLLGLLDIAVFSEKIHEDAGSFNCFLSSLTDPCFREKQVHQVFVILLKQFGARCAHSPVYFG